MQIINRLLKLTLSFRTGSTERLLRRRKSRIPKLVLLFLTSVIFALGTIGTAQTIDIVIAEKEDGRFHATIFPKPTYAFSGGVRYSSEFFESIELDITWWWLFREPVYYHNLKWRLDDNISVRLYKGLPTYLSRRMLESYPDLLARYNALKPQYMEITVDVTLRAMMPIKKISSYGTFFEGSEFRFSKTIKDVELMIAGSGTNGENLSPGTPPGGFREFTSFAAESGVGRGYQLSDEVIENKLAATFINTSSVEFRNAKISKIRIPDKEIKSIYDAFMFRERGCKEFSDNPVSWSCKNAVKDNSIKSLFERFFADDEAESQEQPVVNEDQADFWQGKIAGTNVKVEPTKSVNDGFWQGESGSANEKVERSTQEEDSFWANNKKSGSASSGDSFWETSTDANISETFEIRKEGQKQGVVSKNGNILIPFRTWEVLSYKGDMAEVRVNEPPLNGQCKPRMSYTAFHYGWAWGVQPMLNGYVDRVGDWLTPPDKSYRQSTGEMKDRLVLLSRNKSSMTASERKRAERLEDKFESQLDDCEDEIRRDMKRATRELESKGYRHE